MHVHGTAAATAMVCILRSQCAMACNPCSSHFSSFAAMFVAAGKRSKVATGQLGSHMCIVPFTRFLSHLCECCFQFLVD